MKSRVWVFVFLLALMSIVIATSSLILLHPIGKERVALTADGGGIATWNPEAPAFYTGSYSARLDTGADTDEDGFAGGAGIMVGPENMKLSLLTPEAISYWMYAYSCSGRTPYVDLVLDNGRTMEGTSSVPIDQLGIELDDDPADTVTSELEQGYPSANLWVNMKPSDGWYSSFAANDDLIPDEFAAPQTMAVWQAKFPDAKVIQYKVQYGYGNQGPDADCTVFVDALKVKSRTINIEPETFAAIATPSTGKPFNP